MGAWGTKLYQSDTASDIKDNYIEKQKAGKTAEEALKEVLEENEYCMDDDEKYDFWFALADTLWRYGRLTKDIKQKVLELIEEEPLSGRWQKEKDRKTREKVLIDLKNQLLSEMPPIKKVSVHKPYVTKWKPHEVYVYQIKNPPKGKEEYLGWYITIYVHDVRGHEFVVRGVYDMTPDIYIKVSKEKPKDVSEINDFMFTCSVRNTKTGVGRFRNTLSELSDRSYPKDIEFLGKCIDFKYPQNEEVIEPFSDLVKWYSLEKDAILDYENELKRQQEIAERLKKKADK